MVKDGNVLGCCGVLGDDQVATGHGFQQSPLPEHVTGFHKQETAGSGAQGRRRGSDMGALRLLTQGREEGKNLEDWSKSQSRGPTEI